MKYKLPNDGMDKQDRVFFGAALAVALLVLIITLAGCASMPLDRQWLIASDSYDTSLAGLNAAYRAGIVNETQYMMTYPYQVITEESLKIMEEAAFAKEPDRFKAAMKQMREAVARIGELVKAWSN